MTVDPAGSHPALGDESLPGSEWLVGGGEMGAFVRRMDWSGTPLGPMAGWPPSLRTTVNLALNSNFPISIAWGPEHSQIYNDGYWPVCADKHPGSMGQDFSECWASAFPVIGDTFYSALSGHTGFLEDQRMFLDRRGYLEETFFTFSFSPIRDGSGKVTGLFHPVTETSSRMLAERRTRQLRDVTARAVAAGSAVAGLELVATTIGGADLDVPFSLFYDVAEDGRTAHLVAWSGLRSGTPASPRTVELASPAAGWPLVQAYATGAPVAVENVRERFPGLVCPAYPEPVAAAFVLPIMLPGESRPTCLMVAGVSPRLPMNEAYRSFMELLASAVSTVIANATAIQAERRRAEALAQIDLAKNEFFSNVSHEFRTPLTLLVGPIDDELAALAPDASPERRERLETMHRNSLRLLRLVNTLLDFARIEDGRARAAFELTDLGALTADLAGTFRSACERAGLRLDVVCTPIPGPVYVDPDLWEAIVLNLVSNAFKFTVEGGITVTVRGVDDHAEVVVEDTGVGIPEAELSRVFERFHRVPGVRGRTHEGTGIGLAFVQQLALQHGGSVRAESREGAGTRMTVTLPLGAAHLPAEQVGTPAATRERSAGTRSLVAEALRWITPDQAVTQQAAPDPGACRPRVLLADDNADMRQYVARLLADAYDVQQVMDGAAALAAARAAPPDLVLSDVMMPGLDGFALLRELRGDERTRSVPVILLSARAGEETRIEGLQSGADDYLVKPFSARELLARVDSHVQLAALRREAETGRREADRIRALAESASQLRELNAGLECRVQERTAELVAANKELESFSYSVSHDLRAPLRAIDGFTRLLQDRYLTDLPDEARRYIDVVRRNAQQMGQLVDDLLALSRLGRGPLAKARVDMSELVRRCVEDVRGDCAGRDVRFTIGELPDCEGDAGLLRQVWANLIGNAVKYTRRRPVAEITVDWRTEDDGATSYSCRDNGAGFDMRYADKLFGVFQRLHRAEDYEGTGVGLAIVEQIVRRHGGRVWADAEIDGGATFTFTLGHRAGS